MPVDTMEIPPPKGERFTKTPQELLELMGKALWEFETYNHQANLLEIEKNKKEAITMVILNAKRWDLLENEALRKHYKECTEDPKFRLTLELAAKYVYLENLSIMEKYEYYVKRAKQAEKDHEMWARHLSWYQSENKVKVAELVNT